MWRFRFRCSARPHRVWSRLAGVGFKCRNQELNAFPMDGDPPSKVGYRRATRKYMLTSRFTAYDPKRTRPVVGIDDPPLGKQVSRDGRALGTEPHANPYQCALAFLPAVPLPNRFQSFS